jgi:hypothetical protein
MRGGRLNTNLSNQLVLQCQGVAWNGDGRKLASASGDNSVRIWQLEKGSFVSRELHISPYRYVLLLQSLRIEKGIALVLVELFQQSISADHLDVAKAIILMPALWSQSGSEWWFENPRQEITTRRLVTDRV